MLFRSILFSLPVGTEMFHFPTFPLPALYIQAGVTRSPKGPGQVSPFGNPRIKVRLSTPRGLSQIATSFFGSRCQGIHRSLLETCNHNMSHKTPQHTPKDALRIELSILDQQKPHNTSHGMFQLLKSNHTPPGPKTRKNVRL